MNLPEQDFYKELQKGIRPGDCFLFTGTDSYWMERYNSLIASLLSKDEELERLTIYGSEIKIAELADHLDTISIFSTRRLITIKYADALKKKELDVLAAYFDEPAELQSLIIEAEKIDKRSAAWKKILQHCKSAVCDKPKWASQLKLWLQLELKERGKSMSLKAIDNFIARVELDYMIALNELEKLLLITADRSTITEADIDRSLGSSRLGTQSDFLRALGKQNASGAIALANKMLETDWEALQIVFTIQKFFMSIWKIVLLRAKHISANEIAQTHLQELYPNQRREFVDMAANFSSSSIEKVFDILLELDTQLKSVNTDPKLLLNVALAKICQA